MLDKTNKSQGSVMKFTETTMNFINLNNLMSLFKKNDQGTQNDFNSENSHSNSNIGTKETI